METSNGTQDNHGRRTLRRSSSRAPRLAAGGTITAILLASTLSPTTARAQSDVAPALPNVLILLDTSGSMERLPNASLPAVPTGTRSTDVTQKNRWIQALEVLGGGISNFSIVAVDRNSTDFKNEYSLGGLNPYDTGYYLNHYRPMSNNCTLGAAASKMWPNDWNTWGVGDFGWRLWGGASFGATGITGGCGPTVFSTDGLGVLDTFRDQARFGLMTFDNDPRKTTGWNGSTHDPSSGINGQWSYYPNWDKSSGMVPSYGWPAACKIDATGIASHEYENGARNPSAPPWEGPLVPFASDDSTTSLRSVNDRIRYAILAARPYGATPIGPMLADARYYLQDDPIGPKTDPLGSCRGTFIILITDGFPNQDLRPDCQNNPDPKSAAVYPACDTSTTSTGCCPSKRPQDIAYDLANPGPGKTPVKTFVVGFALSDDAGAAVDCSTIDPTTPVCSTMAATDPKKPCCTLHEIAYNGGTNRALLASDSDTLRAALIKAMSDATATSSTSRTLPVFTSAAGSGQYEFRSSFKPNPFGAWIGKLERVRWQCVSVSGSLLPQEQAFDATMGDDFGKDLNSSLTRNYFSWDGVTGVSPARKSTDSIRPNITSADIDGIEHTVGASVEGSGTTFVSGMPYQAMEIAATSCSDIPAVTLDQCKQKYLNYAVAQPQPKTTWLSRVGNALGDIYHATPVSVGPPSAFIRDESYTDFRNKYLKRPSVILAATNDGLLHAFKTDPTSQAQNELWAFIPPAVLPSLQKQYGGAHALLLDMAPVVKDVPFGSSTLPWGRTRDNAKGGVATWRTVAVGGLTTGRGYYAIDITDVGDIDPTKSKPKLLWQLSTGVDRKLFGNLPAMPAIGTVYYQDPTATVPIETPVAFLPGGEGTLFDTTTSCARWTRPTGVTLPPDARASVRCWIGAGNSFTIVRLYDGKILRTFRNDPAGKAGTPTRPSELTTSPVPLFLSAGRSDLVQDTAGAYATIDSPITGTVALYPGNVGSVTTRAFVGDEDGGLWKLDVSDPNPQKWSFNLFHDAYIAPDTDPVKGQPVAVAPVLSNDKFGNISINYATGDQNNFSTTAVNHVYSLSEIITGTGATSTAAAKVNWHIRLPGGVTPTGPLSLFNSSLYFSTFTPGVSTGSVCLSGQGALWGVDYAQVEPGTGTPGLPMARFQRATTEAATVGDGSCPDSTTHAYVTNRDARVGFSDFFRCVVLDPGTIVFGAGITQRPSCVNSSSASIGTDPYTGASSNHATVGGIAQGNFELVAQTGPKATSSGSIASTTTNTFKRTLVAPMPITRIDSWAAVVE